MYLRQSNKWKEFLLAEGVEDIGLPPTIAHYLRQQNNAFGPIENKHLTWLGELVKRSRTDLLLPRDNLDEIKIQLVQAVRTTLKKRGGDESMAAEKELYDEAVAPLIDFKNQREIRSPNIAEIKSFKKSMMKSLRRLEITPQFIKGFNSYTDTRMLKGVAKVLMDSIKPIMLLLAEDPASYNDLRGEIDLRVAAVKAQDILDNPPKDPDKVIHEFDNGYFWYDIGSHKCDIEAKEMGHCGSADNGTLYSLRVGDKRSVKRMILLAFDGSIVYQIKANANAAPKEHLWPYIDWFLENMGVTRVDEVGQYSKDVEGFGEMLGYLGDKHPDLEVGDTWVEKVSELIDNFESYVDQDSETSFHFEYPDAENDVVRVDLRHSERWPVLDVIVDEDTNILRGEIEQDAMALADLVLYPTPQINSVYIYPQGKSDSRTAMLQIRMEWSESFEPDDERRAESIEEELERLSNFLTEISEVAELVQSGQSPTEDDPAFDFRAFEEGIQEKLKEYGVHRDLAAEIDAEDLRDRERETGQLELPLQEQRIIQRWQQIIK